MPSPRLQQYPKVSGYFKTPKYDTIIISNYPNTFQRNCFDTIKNALSRRINKQVRSWLDMRTKKEHRDNYNFKILFQLSDK